VTSLILAVLIVVAGIIYSSVAICSSKGRGRFQSSVDEADRAIPTVDPRPTLADTTHVNDVLQQWSTGREDEAVLSFLQFAQTHSSDASYRFFNCSEKQFVALPEAERDQLLEKMLAKFKVVRKFARELDRRAKEALAANDYPTAERLLAGLKRWGAANTGPEVARLTDLVGKALEKLADDGLAKLDAARASPERQ
jgi:hypothetical protein